MKLNPCPVLTSQEIFAKLSGCKVFTVLGVQNAFWQIKLDEQSSSLCTFATPEGQYRFLRLPMGIQYIGHILSPEAVKVDPIKVQSITTLPPPQQKGLYEAS